MCRDDDHDRGLQHDLQTLLERRQILTGAAGVGASAALTACDWLPGMSQAQPEKAASANDGGSCVVHPTETAGPFPADGSNSAHGTLANVLTDSGVVRRDIRFDLGQNENPAAGARLDLTLRLVNVNDACRPLAGYAVYLWHCDAEGAYSIYNLPNRNYLRGVGVSDQSGQLMFTTIIPGCYPGRYPHMHFEVYPSLEAATDYRNRILTSQLVIPSQTCQSVYSRDTIYGASLGHFKYIPLDRDGIFRDNTPKQLDAQTIAMMVNGQDGYNGNVAIGLEV